MDILHTIDMINEDAEYAELKTLVSLTEEYFKETKMEAYRYFLEEETVQPVQVPSQSDNNSDESSSEALAEPKEKKPGILKKAGNWVKTKFEKLWKMIIKFFEKIKKFFTGSKTEAQRAETLGNEVDQLYSQMQPEQVLRLQSMARQQTSQTDGEQTSESFVMNNDIDCYYMEETAPMQRTITEDQYHQMVIQAIIASHDKLRSFVPMVVHFNDNSFKKHLVKLGDLINNASQMLKTTATATQISLDSIRSQMKSYRMKMDWHIGHCSAIINGAGNIKKVIRAKNYGKYYHEVQQLILDLNVKVTGFKTQAEAARKSFDKIVNEINAYDKSRKYGDGFVNPKVKEKVNGISDLTDWLLQSVKNLTVFAGDIRRYISEEIKSLDKLKIYANSIVLNRDGSKPAPKDSDTKDNKDSNGGDSGDNKKKKIPRVMDYKNPIFNSIDENDPKYQEIGDDPNELMMNMMDIKSFAPAFKYADNIARLGPNDPGDNDAIKHYWDDIANGYYGSNSLIAVKEVKTLLDNGSDKLVITKRLPDNDIDKSDQGKTI